MDGGSCVRAAAPPQNPQYSSKRGLAARRWQLLRRLGGARRSPLRRRPQDFRAGRTTPPAAGFLAAASILHAPPAGACTCAPTFSTFYHPRSKPHHWSALVTAPLGLFRKNHLAVSFQPKRKKKEANCGSQK